MQLIFSVWWLHILFRQFILFVDKKAAKPETYKTIQTIKYFIFYQNSFDDKKSFKNYTTILKGEMKDYYVYKTLLRHQSNFSPVNIRHKCF